MCRRQKPPAPSPPAPLPRARISTGSAAASWLGLDGITYTAHRLDEFPRKRIVDLPPQTLNRDVHEIRARVKLVPPHTLADLDPRHHLSRRPHETLEQRKLAGRQFDADAAAP